MRSPACSVARVAQGAALGHVRFPRPRMRLSVGRIRFAVVNLERHRCRHFLPLDALRRRRGTGARERSAEGATSAPGTGARAAAATAHRREDQRRGAGERDLHGEPVVAVLLERDQSRRDGRRVKDPQAHHQHRGGRRRERDGQHRLAEQRADRDADERAEQVPADDAARRRHRAVGRGVLDRRRRGERRDQQRRADRGADRGERERAGADARAEAGDGQQVGGDGAAEVRHGRE